MAVIILVPAIDAPLQRSIAAGGTPSLDDAGTIALVGLALAAISHGSSVLLGALVAAAVAEIDRGGEGRWAAALGLWLRRLPALLLGGLASGLALFALLAASSVFLGLATAGAGSAGGPIAFLLVVLAVAVLAALGFLLTRWSLLAPAVVFEGLGPFSSLRRSWTLVRGATWRVLGIGLLVTFAIAVLGWTVVELMGIVLDVLDPALPGIAAPGAVALGGAVQLVLAPLLPLTYAFLFDDLASRPGKRAG
jgi:predicted RecA/RadA family phage recombinase